MNSSKVSRWLTAAGVLAGILAAGPRIAGAAPPLGEHVSIAALVRAQTRYQSRRDTPVDAVELAGDVAALPRITRDWAALILTVAANESGFSARIAAGGCRANECDHGHAWGLFQQHRNLMNESVWGSTDVKTQVEEAARSLRAAYYHCNPRGVVHANWLARTINAYAGHACASHWRGLAPRLSTFARIRGELQQ